jgi:hypothetical protein
VITCGQGAAPSGIRLKSWLIIIWVWPIRYCFSLLGLRLLIDEQSEYTKNRRSKPQGRCELSGGQRLCKPCLFGILETVTVKTVFKSILSIDLVGSILEFYQNMWSEESNELVVLLHSP